VCRLFGLTAGAERVRATFWLLDAPDSLRVQSHALHILERPAGGELHVRSSTSSVQAPELADVPSVVVASEALDGESGWRMLSPGELVHVRADLSVESRIAVSQAPSHLVPLLAGNPNIDT
jgi:glutamine amidotransferase